MRRNRASPIFIIAIVVLTALLVLIDLQGRVFLESFKNGPLAFIKDKIGLEGKIGGIEGGIFRDIVLKDVELYDTCTVSDSGIVKSPLLFSSSAIGLDYRIWDIFLKRFDGLKKITFVSPKVIFPSGESKFIIPKVFDPEWKEIALSVRDGSFYNAEGTQVVRDLNGNFKLNENGIGSNNVNAIILGQRFTGKGSIGFPINRCSVCFGGTIKGEGYALKVELNGALDEMSICGTLDMPERSSLDFTGNISDTDGQIAFSNFNFGRGVMLEGLIKSDRKGFDLNIYPPDLDGNAAALGQTSRIAIKGDFSKPPYFNLNIDINHLKLPTLDVLSNVNVNGKLEYDANNRLCSVVGDFTTCGSVINYEAIRETKGTYEIKDGRLKIQGVNYGDVILANGTISLVRPNDIDVTLKFRGTELSGLTDMVVGKDMISGKVCGDMHIYGMPAVDIKIDSQLEFLNGNISIVKYSSAKVNFRSSNSILEFFDSKVYTETGILTLEGKMDLKEIGTDRIFRSVEIKSAPNNVIWAGVNTMKRPEGQEVVFGTDITERFRVNLKTYESNKTPKGDEMELEYKLGEPASMKLRMKENDDFFGLEHKVRF